MRRSNMRALVWILSIFLILTSSCQKEQTIDQIDDLEATEEIQPLSLQTKIPTDPNEIVFPVIPTVAENHVPMMKVDDIARSEILLPYVKRMLSFLDILDKYGAEYDELLSGDVTKVRYGYESNQIVSVYNAEQNKNYQIDLSLYTQLDDYWLDGSLWNSENTSFAIEVGTSQQVGNNKGFIPSTEQLIIYTYDQIEDKYLDYPFTPPDYENRVGMWLPEGADIRPLLGSFEWSPDGKMAALVFSDFQEVFIIDQYGKLVTTVKGIPDYLEENGYASGFSIEGWNTNSDNIYINCRLEQNLASDDFVVKIDIKEGSFEPIEVPGDAYTSDYYFGFENPDLILKRYSKRNPETDGPNYLDYIKLYNLKTHNTAFEIISTSEICKIYLSSEREYILIEQDEAYLLYSVDRNQFLSIPRGDEWVWNWYDGLNGFLTRGRDTASDNREYFRIISPAELFKKYDE